MAIDNRGPETQKTRPPEIPKVSKKMIVLVIFVVIILILSYAVWFFVFRTLTLEEVAAQHFNPGDEVRVGGTITKVERLNTSYGPLTLLTLDDHNISDMYRIVVDNDKEYAVGDWFQTTFHFKEYDFNGNKIVTAKELYMSYMLPFSIGIVLDSVSFIGGFKLGHVSSDVSGTSYYEVFMRNGDQYPLGRFNISIKKGQTFGNEIYTHQTFPALFANEYLAVSGNYGGAEVIDFMDSLEDKVSQNGTVEFIDANSNNLLDDYDKFKLSFQPTEDEFSIESYSISIGGGMSGSTVFAFGLKYVINWHKGPYEWCENYNIGLKYVSTDMNGNLTSTTLKVSKVLQDGAKPYSNYYYLISYATVDYGTGQFHKKNVSKNIEHIENDVYVEYIDANDNSLMDVDDLFVIDGIENQTHVTFKLQDIDPNGFMGTIDWITGYGHIMGKLPAIKLENSGLVQGSPDYYRINVTTSYWHPQLIVNSTLRLLITNNSAEIEPFDMPLEIGVTQSFNGTNVTFHDADGDTYLSSGDYFEIECQPGTTYQFKLFMFKMLLRSIAFTTG